MRRLLSPPPLGTDVRKEDRRQDGGYQMCLQTTHQNARRLPTWMEKAAWCAVRSSHPLIPSWLDVMETLQPRRDPFPESIASLDPCRTLCKPAGPWAGQGLPERKGHGCGSRIRSRFSGNPSCEKLLAVPTGCRVPCVL